MVWVKFHDKLCTGAKRGLPRSVRFVFMELCLHSRPGRGVIDLPVGMSDLDAIQDILGGNRKEVAEAVKLLSVAPPPSPDEPEPRAMIEVTGESGARRLTIPSWDAWNSGQETPGASTERSRKARRAAAASASQAPAMTENTPPGNGDATGMQRSLQTDATVTQRACNGAATPYRGEERREEEKREEPPYPPQAGGGAAVVREAPPESQPPPRTRAGRSKPRALALPGVGAEPADDVFAAYLEARNRVAPGGSAPVLDAKRRRLVVARLEEGHTVERLKAAAAGIFDSAWNVTEKRTGFDLAMRDTEHVERFAAFFEEAEPARRPAGPQRALPEPPPPRPIPVFDADELARRRARKLAEDEARALGRELPSGGP